MEKKCQVVMLPTEKASKLAIHIGDNKFAPLQDFPYPGFTSGIFQCQYLYILSDEEMKYDEWYYNFALNRIEKAVKTISPLEDFTSESRFTRKIIATTNPELHNPYRSFGNIKVYPSISQEFIGYYVKSYNEGNVIKEVMVEYDELIAHDREGNRISQLDVKLNYDDTIIIHEIKREAYTINQINKAISEYIGDASGDSEYRALEDFQTDLEYYLGKT